MDRSSFPRFILTELSTALFQATAIEGILERLGAKCRPQQILHGTRRFRHLKEAATDDFKY